MRDAHYHRPSGGNLGAPSVEDNVWLAGRMVEHFNFLPDGPPAEDFDGCFLRRELPGHFLGNPAGMSGETGSLAIGEDSHREPWIPGRRRDPADLNEVDAEGVHYIQVSGKPSLNDG